MLNALSAIFFASIDGALLAAALKYVCSWRSACKIAAFVADRYYIKGLFVGNVG